VTILLRRPSRRVALYASSSVNRGGTGVYTERLIKGFEEAGISEVVPIGSRGAGLPGKLLSEQFFIPRRVKREKFDLIHLPAFGGRAVRGVPYAVTVHDMAFMARPGWFPLLRSIYYRMHFPGVAARASVIIADSDFTVSEIKKYLGLTAERVYLCAPENTAEDTLFRQRSGISEDYILFTGTIEPRKNVGALLAAWPCIRKVHPGLKLVLAGRWGWGTDETKRLLSSTPGVIWLGSVGNEELLSAFAGARLFIYPSLYEGFGLPPLESAASGVPFVIGPAETLREVFSSVAAAVAGDTALSISESVLNALDTACNRAALRNFAGEFSCRQMALNTYNAYDKAFS
jgi:glycosyltransferase involved in cell wall biosynthesis